jgi:hypothetical protein
MLTKNPDRVVVHFAMNFMPQIKFQRLLSEAAESAQDRLESKLWSYGPQVYVLRDMEKRLAAIFGHNRFGFLGLGLRPWMDEKFEYAKILTGAIQKLGLDKIDSVGFKIQAFLPLGMTFVEISKLMFGSFVVEGAQLEAVCGKPTDVLVQLHGLYNGLKSITVVAPQNAEQATQTFMAIPNLEHLIEPKFLDTGLKDFRDRIAMDCLYVDIDLTMEKVAPDAVYDFTKKSFGAAEEIAEAVVARLKRLPVKKVIK